MPYFSSPLPATRPQTPLSSLASGIARVGGFLTTLEPLGRSLTLRNQTGAVPAAVTTTTLPPGQIVFQEMSSSAETLVQAIPDRAAGQIEEGELSPSDLANTRAALACMKKEYETLTGEEEKRQCMEQINRLQALIPEGLSLARVKAMAGSLMQAVNRVAAAAEPSHESQLHSAAPIVTPPAASEHGPQLLAQPAEASSPVVEEPATRHEEASDASVDGVFNAIKRKVGDQLARVCNLPPAVAHASAADRVQLHPLQREGARTLVPHSGIPTFAHLSHASESVPADTGIVGGLGVWVRANLKAVETQLRRSAEQQEKVNNTAEPDPYTKLEDICAAGTSKSLVSRLTRPSSKEVIRKLLKKPGYQTNPDAGTYGAAHLAVRSGKPKRLAVLLDVGKGRIDVNRVSPKYNATALELAVLDGRKTCMHLLLEEKATVSAKAFELAAMRGEVETFKLLHAYSCSRAAEGRVERKIMEKIDFGPSFTEAVRGNATEIVRFLLEREVHLYGAGYQMMQLAARHGHAEMLEILTPYLPQPYETLCGGKEANSVPLALAMGAGHEKAVAFLLNQHTDRQYVSQVKSRFDEEVAGLCPSDRDRFAPVQARLETWLQPGESRTPANLAVTSETAKVSNDDAMAGVVAISKTRRGPLPFTPRK